VDFQADYQLNDNEKYAISHLCNWLEEVDEAEDIDDAELDESALLYLKSYRESYSRRKPYPVGCLLLLGADQCNAMHGTLTNQSKIGCRQTEAEWLATPQG